MTKVNKSALNIVHDYYMAMARKFNFDKNHANSYFNRILVAIDSINENTIFRKPRIKKYADKGYEEFFFQPKPKSKGRISWYFECKKENENIVIYEIIPTSMMHDSWIFQLASNLLTE